MSDKPAVLQATFTEIKMVKTRKAVQLVFEMPLENMAQAMEVLGVPMPDKETWVAIARLNVEPAEKPRKRFEDMTRMWQAGVLCNNWEFRTWFAKEHPTSWVDPPISTTGPERCADAIRKHLGVKSRSEIDELEADAWDYMVARYHAANPG